MSAAEKFCRDCKWADMNPGSWFDRLFHIKAPRCLNPKITRDHGGAYLVAGVANDVFCSTQRNGSNKVFPTVYPCGAEGKLWEKLS